MRIFRTSFVLVLGVFLLIFGAIFLLFRNGIVERMVERQLTKSFGAKSEIDGLSFNPFGMGAGYEHLAIGDKEQPMRNLVETGEAVFKMEFPPLLMHKMVIDDLRIDKIGVHTPRETSAALAEAPAAKRAEAGNAGTAGKTDASAPSPAQASAPTEKKGGGWDKLIAKTPKIDMQALEQRVDVTGLVKQGGLGSARYIKDVKEARVKMFNDWDDRLKKSHIEQDFESLVSDFKRADPSAINNVAGAKAALETLKGMREKHDKLKSSLNAINYDAQRDFAVLQTTWKELDQHVNDDVTALKKLANLSAIDTSSAARMVFGPAVLRQFADISGYLLRAKRVVLGDSSAQRPPRRAGIDIHFPLERPRPPDFLIRRIAIGGTLADQQSKLDGEVIGMTTDPDAYGRPTTLQLSVENPRGGAWKINGEFDHRTQHDSDKLSVRGSNVQFGRVALHDETSNSMPRAFTPRDAQVVLALESNRQNLRGELQINATKVDFEFDPAPAKSASADIVRKIFADIREVKIDGKISGTWDDPDLKLQSNVDAILAQRVGVIIQQKTAALEQQLRAEINREIQKQRAPVDAMIKERQTALETRIKSLAGANTEAGKLLDKYGKDLEKKTNQGVKDLGNKAKDKLKKLR